MTPSPEAILVWGAGGHGKVVAEVARACGHRLAGFVDSDPAKLGLEVASGGGRVVLAEADLLECLGNGRVLPAGAGAVALAIGDNGARTAGFARLNGWQAPVLVHPSAVVSASACLGRGTVVLPRAVINAEARLGAAVIVNSAAVVEHDCLVEEGGHIGPGAVLTGGVRVGAGSFVGAGATVIPGVRVGADVTVGAGAVVLRDVPDGVTVVGVPARPVRAP